MTDKLSDMMQLYIRIVSDEHNAESTGKASATKHWLAHVIRLETRLAAFDLGKENADLREALRVARAAHKETLQEVHVAAETVLDPLKEQRLRAVEDAASGGADYDPEEPLISMKKSYHSMPNSPGRYVRVTALSYRYIRDLEGAVSADYLYLNNKVKQLEQELEACKNPR